MVTHSDSPAAIVDAKVADGLTSLGITTIGELLRYAPRRYVHRLSGPGTSAERLEPGEWTTVIGHIVTATVIPMRKRHGSFLKVVVSDGQQRFEATFFNPHAIKRVLRPNVRVMLAGTVKYFQEQVQLTHPQWMVLPDGDPEIDKVIGSSMMAEMYALEHELTEGKGAATPADIEMMSLFDRPIVPMYPANKDIQTWTIWSAIVKALTECEPAVEALTDAQRAERGLITTADALQRVHLPESEADITGARHRLKFDEALAIQAVLAQRRLAGRGERAPQCPHVDGGLEDQLLARLPFELTEGQRLVLAEIGEDLGSPEPMSRLLQGEVGSGKTLVSLLAMLRAVDNGHQCVILAPTEVLAAQHLRTIRTMLGDLGIGGELGAAPGAATIALLTGSMKTKGKRQTLLDVVTGTANIVVGTHALLEEHVEFFDLGMIVVDEQHRFGVEQRDTLRSRGKDGLMPHFLVMTATPIPRTVAMTAFGDLDTSVLTELPRGRQPITTTIVPMKNEKWVDRTWARAAEEIQAGRQVYVVCSRIGDDESTPAGRKKAAQKRAAGESDGELPATVSAVEMFEELDSGPLHDKRVGLLHGRLPAEEKNETMDEFTRGELDLVVATTVIEVGVDVPNATMMIIVDADRFGVSQLHQLRGRVGRGRHPGLCLLMTNAHPASQAMERLTAVAASNDGFELARVDLAQRREGDVLGSLQSGGTSSLRYLSLLSDDEVIADARDFVEPLVEADITLASHRALADLVDAILVPQKVKFLDKS